MARRFGGETLVLPDAGTAAELVPDRLCPGDVVLVKGSRGVGLELVCRALERGGARLMGSVSGRTSDRGHRVAADVPVPEPEVHRVRAAPRIWPEHSGGRTPGPPYEGRHADARWDRDHRRVRGPVPDPDELRVAVDRRVPRDDRVRGARVRRRLHEDRQAALTRVARAHQADRHGPDLDRAVVGRGQRGPPPTRSGSGSSTARSTSGRSTRC